MNFEIIPVKLFYLIYLSPSCVINNVVMIITTKTIYGKKRLPYHQGVSSVVDDKNGHKSSNALCTLINARMWS